MIANSEHYILVEDENFYVVYEIPQFEEVYRVPSDIFYDENYRIKLLPNGQIIKYIIGNTTTIIDIYIYYLDIWDSISIEDVLLNYNWYNGYFIFTSGKICSFTHNT